MSEWEPATEAEAVMRNALAASDQEHYFRVLARMELVLPVSADALAGRVPMGWGTWTAGNRTHVLAFTSPQALYACLNDASGSYRTLAFHTLAAEWPNYEWWLAVNPGLPIEAYLPSWFVAQLTRGDARLPGRTPSARSRISQSDLTAALNGRVRATTRPGPAPTAIASTPIRHAPGGIAPPGDPFVETVDAEIIDQPAEAFAGEATSRLEPRQSEYTEAADAPDLFAVQDSFAASAGATYAAAPGSSYAAAPGSSYAAAPGTSFAAPLGTSFAAPPSPSGAEPAAAGLSSPAPGAPPTAYEEPTVLPPAAPSPGAGARTGVAAPAPAQAATGYEPGMRARQAQDAEIVAGPTAGRERLRAGSAPRFVPSNETEASLFAAAESGNTDAFLSTLLLARVIVPVPPGTKPGARPRDRDFPWRVDSGDGQRFIAVFTSPERQAEHPSSRYGREMDSVSLRFVQLIAAWPDAEIGFAINPGSPVGATLPGSQIVALAAWATEVGLRDEPSAEVVVAPKRDEATPASVAGAPVAGADRATVMQRTIPPAQVPFYLERGYDRVSGFVNRAGEVAHLTTPKALYRALGLIYAGSPFGEDDTETHVLRWVAHRSDLYRLPYGGQHEAAMRAMQGWVIERAPFRGNGFAPGDTDVVAEFKVDSIRLPHGAQLWRLSKDGQETLIAIFDADTTRWVPAPLGFLGGWRA